MNRRIRFAARLLLQRLAGADRCCPYCGSVQAQHIYRKFLLLEVLRCPNCRLMFRYPKDSWEINAGFYQQAYDVFEDGLVTSLPNDEQLADLQRTGFVGSRWDSTDRFTILNQYAPRGRILDYGCSWGYFMYQALQRGYEPIGFEVSSPRAEFGREKLRLEILSMPSELRALPEASIDVIYTSHVLEHLPGLAGVFEEFARLLRPNGTLLISVPNCGGDNARRLGVSWGPFVNEAHTIAFEASFFEKNLPQHGFEVRCFSDPYDEDLGSSNTTRSCMGDELLIVGRKLPLVVTRGEW